MHLRKGKLEFDFEDVHVVMRIPTAEESVDFGERCRELESDNSKASKYIKMAQEFFIKLGMPEGIAIQLESDHIEEIQAEIIKKKKQPS